MDGRMAPRTVAMDTFRWGSGGTSFGEWEHNNNKNLISVSGEPGLVDRVFALHAGVEGSTPTGGTCPNDFPIQ